jgi:pyruvate dehydrogenase E2 component (dihydrolipoamide acetyltransferase)
MAKEVFMPKLSSTMALGTLLQWFKEEGDAVEVGEPLFEIMTDKINIEVESYEEGILLKRFYEVDDEIPVNAVIGYIGNQGESVPSNPPIPNSLETEGEEFGKSQNDDLGKEALVSEHDRLRATPAARRVAHEHNVQLSSVLGSGPKGRIQEQDVLQVVEDNRILITPLAEKIANDNKVDLSQINGTGAREKIEKHDILTYLEADQAQPTTVIGERVKLKGLRKAIADRMLESVRSIPHVTLTSDVDMSKAIALRKTLLPVVEDQTGFRLSYTEIIMKTVAHTLRNHPKVNASLIDNEIVFHNDVNVGLAVAMDDGLIVPSVKQANKKGLAELTIISKTLGAKARENKLTPEEMKGSTFTISNLGMYAVDGFTPLINPPETAILGVGRIVEKPVVVSGTIDIRPMMVLSLTFDHRVIDGAPAAAFLTELKQNLEDPYSLLV